MDFVVYGTDGGAALRSIGATEAPVGNLRIFKDRDGENADYEVVANPGAAHDEVVGDFIAAIRDGESTWKQHVGSLALVRARILDACYTSASELREVKLCCDHPAPHKGLERRSP
jgi:predicted dehydrogenase